MIKRVILWIFFGFALSMTPLLLVAAIEWPANSGTGKLLHILFQEEMLEVALTLGVASVGTVLASGERYLLLKLVFGGYTFLMTLWCVAAYVVIKAHVKVLTQHEVYQLVTYLTGATLVGGFLSELLREA